MSASSSRTERFLVVSILALLCWLPIPLGSNRDWSMGLLVMLVGLLGSLWAAGSLLGWVRTQTPWRTVLPMLLALLATQVWVAVQWLGGLTADGAATFQYLMLGLAYSLLFAMIVQLFATRRRLTLLLATLLFSGALQAFYGAFMTLSGIEWLLLGRKEHYLGHATGTFVNRNHLAGYLELTLACGIGLLLALRDGRPFSWRNLLETLLTGKAMLRILLVIMVIGLVMTHSRGGNTAFFSALLLVGGLLALRDKANRKRNILILASILLIDMLIISQYFGLDKLKDRLVGTRINDVVVNGQIVERQNIDRDEVFVYALPLFTEKPLAGQGAGSFEAVFQQKAGPDIVAYFDHAHNDYLQFLIEYGLIGSLPLLIFVLLAFVQALRTLWRQESLYRSGVAFGALMGMAALAIHSVSDFNLQIPANAATLVVVCAIALLAGTHVHQRRVRETRE